MGVCETHCSPGLEGAENGVLRGWGWGVLHPMKGGEMGKEGSPGSQRMGQPLRRLFLRTWRPARVAISNTSRTPSLVLAEHSR